QKPCEPLGPIYLLRTVRDQINQFQERRGLSPQENNFLSVLAVMVNQAGQAMYAVFTMFLALIPAATILLHIVHFVIDRVLDIVTTRGGSKQVWTKVAVFALQLAAIYFGLKFILTSIFGPIFSMQSTIITKMFMLDGGVKSCG
ncbi:hypothetical protein AAG570_010211, partial [Ranatra chinensis]